MGIKMLRGTTGRSRRGVFSRELVDFETRFERVWPVHEGIDPARLGSQLETRKRELDVNNIDEPLEGGREPGVEPPSPVKMNYPPL
jgi:hypothetical protein